MHVGSLHGSTFVKINFLFLFVLTALWSELHRGTGGAHTVMLWVSFPGCQRVEAMGKPQKLSKSESRNVTTRSSLELSPSCLPDLATMTSSLENPQTGTRQPYFLPLFYWTQRKLIAGKSVCCPWCCYSTVLLADEILCALQLVHQPKQTTHVTLGAWYNKNTHSLGASVSFDILNTMYFEIQSSTGQFIRNLSEGDFTLATLRKATGGILKV